MVAAVAATKAANDSVRLRGVERLFVFMAAFLSVNGAWMECRMPKGSGVYC